jgi:hypothetical protein
MLDAKGIASGVLIDGNPEGLVNGVTYCTIDSMDLATTVMSEPVCGRDWVVYLSGSLPILAVNRERRITIQSLHRLEAWERMGRPMDPESRSLCALSLSERLWNAQARLGLKPGTGFSRSVAKLAPGLAKIRPHGGDAIFCRERLIRGGRLEVLRTKASERLNVWDMKSAYAGAYKHGIPGNLIQRIRTLPGHTYYSALVTVGIPDDASVPCVPFRRRSDGRLLFPTGTWQTWLCGPEVQALAERGWLRKVHEVRVYERIDPFDSMLATLWPIRTGATDKLERDYAKLLLVSGYGVLNQAPAYPVWYVNPSTPMDPGKMIRPGLFAEIERPKRTHAHPFAAAWILSHVRARLQQVLEHPGACYCAVDSVTLPSDIQLPTGTSPGDWSLDKSEVGGEWKAQGVYALGGGAVLRSSGVERQHAPDFFAGNEVRVERRCSPASAMMTGKVQRAVVSLRLAVEKDLGRVPVPGDAAHRTRPLNVSEVESAGKLGRRLPRGVTLSGRRWRLLVAGGCILVDLQNPCLEVFFRSADLRLAGVERFIRRKALLHHATRNGQGGFPAVFLRTVNLGFRCLCHGCPV